MFKMIGMGDLLISLCSYMALQGSGVNACHSAVTASYIQSGIKPVLDEEQHYFEKRSAALYSQIPYNHPLGAIFLLGKDIKEKDFKIPLDNHVNLEYINFNAYTCNLRWEF